ncbi:putative ABC transporter ATP-binding protein [Dictyobacter alpinus]|uniref:Putative ABC transporter ATP-binding protein n=1 Tax=Dictyobacter alpinus TaxID=2014873 RepID=A0A402BB29_9CHLR|nr:ABC transporter ATP-binding protein [Dictyobacter alpinus]GCE28555.1 putative ABC transporter ATP-binding protein [Dictyobacter alpinus]
MSMSSYETSGTDVTDEVKPTVLLEHVRFRYTAQEEPEATTSPSTPLVLDDISFSLLPGELLLIAGPSGCGKSTLLKCLNGLIPHTYSGNLSGEIRLNGQAINGISLRDLARQIGTMLQDPDKQIVGSTVEQEIAFGMENLGVSRAQMRQTTQNVLQQLKLEAYRDRATHALSGGQRQLVAAAGLLVMEPAIFLFDEPFASLDSFAVDELEQLIHHLRQEGHAIIIVEHRVEEALRLDVNKVLLLDHGRQAFFGAVPAFLARADPDQIKLPVASKLQQLGASVSPQEVRKRLVTPIITGQSAREEKTTDAGDTILSFENIHYRYTTFSPEILRGVSFQIRRGETIALLGPNGSGKTTLVKQALGLLRPTQGSIQLYGKESKKMSVARIAGQVGYVFQYPGAMLYAPTVRQEVSFGPENLGFQGDQLTSTVEQALTAVNVQDFADQSPFTLSFGQQKRVTIASILAMRSKILLLDEPTAGQDYRSYIAFIEHIRRIPDLDALLFITHDLDLALRFTQRVLLLKDGRVEADGPPLEILRDQELLQRCHLRPTSLLNYLMSS